MARPKGSNGSFNSLMQTRANTIWRNLIDEEKFDWAKEWMIAFDSLVDPRDKISALKMVGEFFLPKPPPARERDEDFDEPVGPEDIDESYERLKAMTLERLKRECQTALIDASTVKSEPTKDESPEYATGD